MIDEKQMTKLTLESRRAEIQRAIRRVKRPRPTELDRWFRREWHRAAAMSSWPEWRQRLYWEWKRRKEQGDEAGWT